MGCGSVGVTQQLLEAAGEPGAEVLYAWRSFEAYPTLVDLSGGGLGHGAAAGRDARPGRDGRRDHRPDPAHLRLQPEQPDRHRGARGRAGGVPRPGARADCLVVLDEAYHEYVRDPDVPDGMDLYRDRPNVAVLRTFSKAYGLAGLRVGFLVGHAPVAAAVRKTMLPFTVNAVAQAAAIASLAAEARTAGAGGRGGQGAGPGPRRAARPGLVGAADRGQLRLAAARRGHPGLRRGLRRGPGSRSGRSPRRAPGSRSATTRRTTRSWPWPAPIPAAHCISPGVDPAAAQLSREPRAPSPGAPRRSSFSVTSR